jgi:hypothetical protein
MNRIPTLERDFSHCDQAHASCDQQHLRQFVWAPQLDGACL